MWRNISLYDSLVTNLCTLFFPKRANSFQQLARTVFLQPELRKKIWERISQIVFLRPQYCKKTAEASVR